MGAARSATSRSRAADPSRTPWFADLRDGSGAAEALDPALRRVLETAVVDLAAEQAARIVAAEEAERAKRAAEEAERRRIEREARLREEAEAAERRRVELRRIRAAVRKAAWQAFGLRLLLTGTIVGTLQTLVSAGLPRSILESLGEATTSSSTQYPTGAEVIPMVFGAVALLCVLGLLVADLVLGPPARRLRRTAVLLAGVVGGLVTALQWRTGSLTDASWAWLPVLVTVAHVSCGVVSGVRVRVRLGEPVTVEEASTGLR